MKDCELLGRYKRKGRNSKTLSTQHQHSQIFQQINKLMHSSSADFLESEKLWIPSLSKNGSALKCPVNLQDFLVDFIAVHPLDGQLSLLELGKLNERVPLCHAGLPIKVEVQAFDFPVVRECVEHMILQYLLVEVGDNDDPTLNGCIAGRKYIGLA
jgi:hypothetical protein